MFTVSRIQHRLTKHYHVSKCGWQRVRAGRNNHVLEKSDLDIMSRFVICRVSFQKHSNKHESCKHESGQTRPPANTIFTKNFSISQNFPQTNLLKMTLLQLTYSGEIICKKMASCPNESRHQVFTSYKHAVILTFPLSLIFCLVWLVYVWYGTALTREFQMFRRAIIFYFYILSRKNFKSY